MKQSSVSKSCIQTYIGMRLDARNRHHCSKYSKQLRENPSILEENRKRLSRVGLEANWPRRDLASRGEREKTVHILLSHSRTCNGRAKISDMPHLSPETRQAAEQYRWACSSRPPTGEYHCIRHGHPQTWRSCMHPPFCIYPHEALIYNNPRV